MANKDNYLKTSHFTRTANNNKTVSSEDNKAELESAKTKITLSITQSDRDAVKMFAIQNHTTVSDLLHKWIVEKCGE